jgi:hypothetical protein
MKRPGPVEVVERYVDAASRGNCEAAARLTTDADPQNPSCLSFRHRKLLRVRLIHVHGNTAGVAINLEPTPEESRLELPPDEWSMTAVLSKRSGEWLIEGLSVML